MDRTALIDGDEWAYVAAFSTQQKYYVVYDGDKEIWKHTVQKETIEKIGNKNYEMKPVMEVFGLEPGLVRARKWLADVLEHTKCTKYRIFLNGKNNFRYELATILPYKGNRFDAVKPELLEDIRDWIRDSYDSESVDYLESDDLLSINHYNSGGSTVCVTQDKDLNMIAGWRYSSRNRNVTLIDDASALKSFYYQLLTGDATDNIPGLFRVGPVGANKLLADCQTEKEYYQVVLKAYRDQMAAGKPKWTTEKSTEDVIWEIGNLLWMRRELGENAYWQPPK